MLTACWSVKGGSGTTVVAASLTLAMANAGRPVTAADFDGDLPFALGLPDPSGPGLRNWLDAGPGVPADGLQRIAAAGAGAVTLIPRGEWTTGLGQNDLDAAKRLASSLRQIPPNGPVIADCGIAYTPTVRAFIAQADRSLLVLRPCYLALRRAVNAPRPSAVIVVNEPCRALSPRDVEDALGVPVAAIVEWEPAVARAVDTGLLQSRLPRRMAQALRGVAA